ncbi:MAG TPA: hypothetical protein VFS43_25750 [Polyangiaceae bacterium]|nr:hypothetical protein [Polyangiaceae bacterium]
MRTRTCWPSLVAFLIASSAAVCRADAPLAAAPAGGADAYAAPAGGADASAAPAGGADASAAPVGLSLWWQDGAVRDEAGQPRVVDLYEDFRRYVQELDITARVVTGDDQGIEPLKQVGDMAGLDWTGVEFVEEDWRPDFEGGFTRSRFYRKARWMERYSVFALVPVDGAGKAVGLPILEVAGLDDAPLPGDDGFVRRFDARQVTPRCPAIGDCSGATEFIAQGLVQVRYALQPGARAVAVPAQASRLKLLWTEDPGNPRYVDVARRPYADTPYRYGFAPSLEALNAPANGAHYAPGEAIDVRVTFRDGAGNRLHPEGSLPTYADFVEGRIASGLRYYDGFQELLTLYYALKHREGLTMWSLSGPTDRVRFPSHVVGFFDFLLPQTPTATVAEDGFSAVAALNPRFEQLVVPELRGTPVSDTVRFVVPADAPPGTYVLTVKARRDWGGEALNRAATLEVQVGQAAPTGFQPDTGGCEGCHSGRASLANVLHGLGDRRACPSCHAKLAFEPDHALDYRVHLIHTRSERVAADVYDCSLCHLTTPEGPPRGYPGVGPF